MRRPVIPTIVLAQPFGGSLWFSANGVGEALMRVWGIGPAEIGQLTNAVQAGFILGTLGFALSVLADRFAASRIFALCALIGAAAALATSGLCCALFPRVADASPAWLLGFFLLWGLSVPADSPQFSAMSARACPPEIVGSAQALQNAIGFALTIVSISWGTAVVADWGPKMSWLLLPGPVPGVIALLPLLRGRSAG